MAAFNFPNSPSTNDTHTENGVQWKWNGSVWKRVETTGPQGQQGHQGRQGSTGAQGAQGNPNAFPSGTRMIFQQSSAPTGWTKDTTDTHQRAMRVTSGNVSSGGNQDFTDTFRNWSTNNHTLTAAQIPSHRHWVSRAPIDDNNQSQWNTNTQEFGLMSDAGSYSASDQNRSVGRNTAYTGSGTTHDHDMDLRIQYVDVIICQRD